MKNNRLLFTVLGILLTVIFSCSKNNKPSFSYNKDWIETAATKVDSSAPSLKSVSVHSDFLTQFKPIQNGVKETHPNALVKSVSIQSILLISSEVINPFYADQISIYLSKGDHIPTSFAEINSNYLLIGKASGTKLQDASINIDVLEQTVTDYLADGENVHLTMVTNLNKKVNELSIIPHFEVRVGFDALFEDSISSN